jgi:hypothetical protein
VPGNIVKEVGVWQKQSSPWFQAVTARTMLSGAEKRVFLRHFILKMIVSPRQARDKHRENSTKDAFLQEMSSTTVGAAADDERKSCLLLHCAIFFRCKKSERSFANTGSGHT